MKSTQNKFKFKTYKYGEKTLKTKSKIGEGGFAEVYMMKDQEGMRYAIKYEIVDSSKLDKFKEEIEIYKIASKHKNVVPLLHYEIREFNKKTYETFELLEYEEGSLLDEVMEKQKKNERFNEEKIFTIFLQVCTAVEYFHQHSIKHRDLKIENILISSDGKYKICDFGSATRSDFDLTTTEGKQEAENEIEKLTTMIYCSPEMLDVYSGNEITCTSDVWSLGCLLYQLAYFCQAFTEKLAILQCSYTIPEDVKGYESINELLSHIFVADPEKRMTSQQLVKHVSGILQKQPLESPRGSFMSKRNTNDLGKLSKLHNRRSKSFVNPPLNTFINSPKDLSFKTPTIKIIPNSNGVVSSPRVTVLPNNFIDTLKNHSQAILQSGPNYWKLVSEENTAKILVKEWINPTVSKKDPCSLFYNYIETYFTGLNSLNGFKVCILIFNLMNGSGSYHYLSSSFRNLLTFQSIMYHFSTNTDDKLSLFIFKVFAYMVEKLKWHSVHHYFEGNYSLETFLLTLQSSLGASVIPSLITAENIMEWIQLMKLSFDPFSFMLDLYNNFENSRSHNSFCQILLQIFVPFVRELYGLYVVILNGLQNLEEGNIKEELKNNVNVQVLKPLNLLWNNLRLNKGYASFFGNPPDLFQEFSETHVPLAPSNNPNIKTLREYVKTNVLQQQHNDQSFQTNQPQSQQQQQQQQQQDIFSNNPFSPSPVPQSKQGNLSLSNNSLFQVLNKSTNLNQSVDYTNSHLIQQQDTNNYKNSNNISNNINNNNLFPPSNSNQFFSPISPSKNNFSVSQNLPVISPNKNNNLNFSHSVDLSQVSLNQQNQPNQNQPLQQHDFLFTPKKKDVSTPSSSPPKQNFNPFLTDTIQRNSNNPFLKNPSTPTPSSKNDLSSITEELKSKTREELIEEILALRLQVKKLSNQN